MPIENLGRYTKRKDDLRNLIKTRGKLLQQLIELAHPAAQSSSVDLIYHFDVVQAQELIIRLTECETKIEALIAEINTYAEKIGKEPITIKTFDG